MNERAEAEEGGAFVHQAEEEREEGICFLSSSAKYDMHQQWCKKVLSQPAIVQVVREDCKFPHR